MANHHGNYWTESSMEFGGGHAMHEESCLSQERSAHSSASFLFRGSGHFWALVNLDEVDVSAVADGTATCRSPSGVAIEDHILAVEAQCRPRLRPESLMLP